MKKKRFSVEQDHCGVPTGRGVVPAGAVCRRDGISEQTFYRWRKQHRGMMPSEARELMQFRVENTKLKRLVDELRLNKVMLQARIPCVRSRWSMRISSACLRSTS